MNPLSVTAILTSGRTLKQGSSMESGKLSKDYFDEVSVCEMDTTTLNALEIEEGAPVLIKSDYGSVVVRSRIDIRAEAGVVFIPCGPYANMVISSDTESSGMPDYKATRVEISPAGDEKILTIEEILRIKLGVT
jgi:formylmethanofuran dehydrogenase subunit D